jgi:hypothetical protein
MKDVANVTNVSKQLVPLVLTLAAAATALVTAQQPPAMTAIRAARLFDGKSDAVITDAVVLVQGSRITGGKRRASTRRRSPRRRSRRSTAGRRRSSARSAPA